MEELNDAEGLSIWKACGWILLGGSVLALGADILVGSSVELAVRMGVSDALIGLTIVAFGTSLPELATSLAAARSGQSDLCAGNIVGSNLFNLLLIGGTVSTVVPIPVDPRLLHWEFPALMVLTLLLLWMFKTGHAVTRREGLVLLFCYFCILIVFAFLQA